MVRKHLKVIAIHYRDEDDKPHTSLCTFDESHPYFDEVITQHYDCIYFFLCLEV